MVTALIGAWIQDDTGPLLTMRKRYEFRRDGSYEFAWTSRNTGSMHQTVQASERGTLAAEASWLTLSPEQGSPKSFAWRIERNPYVGNIQLVLGLADGKLDVYYPDETWSTQSAEQEPAPRIAAPPVDGASLAELVLGSQADLLEAICWVLDAQGGSMGVRRPMVETFVAIYVMHEDTLNHYRASAHVAAPPSDTIACLGELIQIYRFIRGRDVATQLAARVEILFKFIERMRADPLFEQLFQSAGIVR
jgi:hypothetical protein